MSILYRVGVSMRPRYELLLAGLARQGRDGMSELPDREYGGVWSLFLG